MTSLAKLIMGLGLILYLFNLPLTVFVLNFQAPGEDSYLLIGKTAIKAKNRQDVEYIRGEPKILVRVASAYNAVESQTDSEPCITASGLNVCGTKRKILASNEFPFGSRLRKFPEPIKFTVGVPIPLAI
ncbi:hypothetical protein LCGC14_2980330 [marine sediment metagenome]|uniref:Uncharacterized protein n=1 Tax=marine sediment metagenome TaxID=412755 RepID=A0A0F8X7M9_9ZZZZ